MWFSLSVFCSFFLRSKDVCLFFLAGSPNHDAVLKIPPSQKSVVGSSSPEGPRVNVVCVVVVCGSSAAQHPTAYYWAEHLLRIRSPLWVVFGECKIKYSLPPAKSWAREQSQTNWTLLDCYTLIRATRGQSRCRLFTIQGNFSGFCSEAHRIFLTPVLSPLPLWPSVQFC